MYTNLSVKNEWKWVIISYYTISINREVEVWTIDVISDLIVLLVSVSG